MKTAQRLERIEPFYVMECAKAANAIAASPQCDPLRGGTPMIYLNIGEPDFTAPALVCEAAAKAIRDGRTHYTPAMGLPELREKISQWYRLRYQLEVPARRIVVTAGASAALQLACLTLFEAGDEVLMSDPGYPCNRHFVAAAQATPRLLPCPAATRFQPDADMVASAWQDRTRGVLLASPSNPTGTSIHPQQVRQIAEFVAGRGGVTVVDEIYLALGYDPVYDHSALALGEAASQSLVSINSFSKYFSMTGWRLGWLVLPDALVPLVEKLAQNLYICAPSISQYAALACFEPASIAEYDRRRDEFRRRRDYVVHALSQLRLPVPVQPDGGFYAWIDCSEHSADSWDFTFDLMRRAHVALTPGRDFGRDQTRCFMRLSFASSMANLQQAMQRLRALL
jgi:aspartate/methionine/tyrosine aminotransferase